MQRQGPGRYLQTAAAVRDGIGNRQLFSKLRRGRCDGMFGLNSGARWWTVVGVIGGGPVMLSLVAFCQPKPQHLVPAPTEV